ncbi:MAG: hypothetical protein ACREIC_28560 [Limisphaerales bacterium]
MKTNSWIVLLAILSAGSDAVAGSREADVDIGPAKQIADRFMAFWCGSHTNDAFAALIARTWYKPEEALAAGKGLEGNRQKAQLLLEAEDGSRLCPPFEYLGARCLGRSSLRLVYLEKFEYKALLCVLDFYRPEGEWRFAGLESTEHCRQDMLAVAVDAPPFSTAPEPVVEDFLNQLSRGQGTAAWDGLFRNHWVRRASASAMAEQFGGFYRNGSALADLTLGKRLPEACERAATRRIGGSFVWFICLEKHQYGFLPISLMFYKGQQDWKLYEVALGDHVAQGQLAAAAVVRPALADGAGRQGRR